jgi:hypothetical protein
MRGCFAYSVFIRYIRTISYPSIIVNHAEPFRVINYSKGFDLMKPQDQIALVTPTELQKTLQRFFEEKSLAVKSYTIHHNGSSMVLDTPFMVDLILHQMDAAQQSASQTSHTPPIC